MGAVQAEVHVRSATQVPEGNVENLMAEILADYKGEKNEIIPILQQAQQRFGYLPEQAMKQIAEFVKVPASTIYGVATFYAQFKFVQTGKKVVRVCRGTGCYVRGAPRILSDLENKLGVKDGGTTPDLEYTLETVACFGSCALAPVVVVNDRVHGRMTPDKVKEILEKKS